MTIELLILILVIGTALAFDFTNGFHDTANASGVDRHEALKPKTAVALAAILNLVGAFLSVEVAKTVASGSSTSTLSTSTSSPKPTNS